jgi:hypothetical protein
VEATYLDVEFIAGLVGGSELSILADFGDLGLYCGLFG